LRILKHEEVSRVMGEIKGFTHYDPIERVRGVLTDYAEKSKKRNQSGTDYV
jgi:hypothetical protein